MNPQPLDATAPEQVRRVGLSLILGLSFGDVVTSAVAIAMGVTHGASWLIALCAVGLIGDAVLFRYARRRSMFLTPESAPAFLAWARTRGMRYGMLASLPIFAAVGLGAYFLHQS